MCFHVPESTTQVFNKKLCNILVADKHVPALKALAISVSFEDYAEDIR